jgi:hypothetical protein
VQRWIKALGSRARGQISISGELAVKNQILELILAATAASVEIEKLHDDIGLIAMANVGIADG